ncbi:tyrosine-type recombinase/integrase [Pseudonocardia sp. KRD-184]|uniref:Tyrosine-type recombinase/integrase n=1 Tax=Pseudonocardia oceani TaxID=2792013 RepID=A0ABS6UBB3_9PSEU|nr:tyrosine-type recombinase/integrase [Pseudonocardia oceani]MBW0092086.1 tyrosine-type recombinase/integrase [Pseudonocardia oceani]MBW0099017.1 tyrosine-type recombinase/integrase [Pseudonocardia oceani]MBW0111583.1 tyrosine-type recombinase/integrase [Pseudonocardia oceani]MBW0124065.1 tyrosine-type recombinase/integrase [Pseudonocardia oceani]MBW0129534.1 tyrosine-type recombinase/integrase [Pseudonocardia oceani]
MPGSSKRQRGEIEKLPSGSLRVRVYAGLDALSGKRNYLVETVPAGPKATAEAEKVRRRLVHQVDERRNPRTKATVNQLMDRYLELLDVEETTLDRYEQTIRVHIRPLLGHLPLAKLDGETLDNHQAILRRCRAHCDGRPFVEHAADGPHQCSEKCRPHVCRPLATSTIRKVHFCLSGALGRAVRWRWITVNPLDQAEPPRGGRSDPNPPTSDQAAAILNAAFPDFMWGCFLWLAMTTGARRGELCAMRWNLLDLDRGVLTIRSSIAQQGTRTWEKDTKTHQQRRIALDDDTVALLRTCRRQCEQNVEALGTAFSLNGHIFSTSLDHSTWLRPSSVSNRYARMCRRLGWQMNLHQLRHYSATELITAGVDVRTVAGRLGHGGGGSTTLRTYTAWVAETDQRAMKSPGVRMPAPPIGDPGGGASVARSDPPNGDSPYQRIAADLRAAISCAALTVNDPLPTVETLQARYAVSAGTANRAVALLKAEGLVIASRGKRAVVSAAPSASHTTIDATGAGPTRRRLAALTPDSLIQ